MPSEERASTAPLTRRAARRATSASTPTAPTRRQLRDAATPVSPRASMSLAPERAAEPVVQLEVVQPVGGEPIAEPVMIAETVVEPSEQRDDEFERAARLFAFTGENPTVSTAPAAPVSTVVTASTADSVVPVKSRSRRARRITAASLSLVAIGAVGLLTVGMTLPSQAVAAASGTTARPAGDVGDGGDGDIQAYVAPASSGGDVQGSLQQTSGFTTGTEVQLAGTDGISNVSGSVFSNNQNCPVQWPFAVGVPISYGFGPRPGEFHEGADFTPGNGAHIQAIADGVVVVAQDNYQGYGTAVIIDHVINGQKVASLYGHMQLGSLQVRVGQKVKVGEYIGRTGDTGHSFGAHTHVEIRQNDVTPIDPVPWLRAHNQC